MQAAELIETLELNPHPEGGYYRETYHSPTWMSNSQTEETYGGNRRSATCIYFLLERSDVSHFHRLKSDELWFFHAGDPLTVHAISPDGKYHAQHVGCHVTLGQSPQHLVPKGHIFGATVESPTGESQFPPAGFSLVSCMVTPGFDFADFELFERNELTAAYPQHKDIISRLT